MEGESIRDGARLERDAHGSRCVGIETSTFRPEEPSNKVFDAVLKTVGTRSAGCVVQVHAPPLREKESAMIV